MKPEERCEAIVYHRDCYRYTGRGPSGFEMHYKKDRCKRRAVNDGFCKQHQVGAGRYTPVRGSW